MKRFFALFCCIGCLLLNGMERVVVSGAEGRFKTMDPIMADDLTSRDMLGIVYDTLLEYDYLKRPYALKPAMLAEMPVSKDNCRVWCFKLRQDLCFADDPVLKSGRKITVDDVFYSLKRLADARNHSPLFWLIRGKIAGIDEFFQQSSSFREGDNRIYDYPVPGLVKKNDYEFEIHLTAPNPRFLYMLAFPGTSIVPRQAVEYYGLDFARHPVGSGPFILRRRLGEQQLFFERNPEYRIDFFPQADNPADRRRPLPLADKLEIRVIRQPLTAWLSFLRGELDLTTLDKDRVEMAGSGGNLAPALLKRGIRLHRQPSFEIRYVGFNFQDPLLGTNLKFRRALSLAYNVPQRVKFFHGQLIPVNQPIPPGVAGYSENFTNAFAGYDLAAARREMLGAKIQPGTVLTFDQDGSSSIHRQVGELISSDFEKIGIKVNSSLNNKPRFFDKLRRGNFQLFRLSWSGDYPDAENFLQLFASGNIGGCNRTGYANVEFDKLYAQIVQMPNGPEREKLCRKAAEMVAADCVWIFEGIPVSSQLSHSWLQNYRCHEFPFQRWKYLSVDPEFREKERNGFTPLSLREMRGE